MKNWLIAAALAAVTVPAGAQSQMPSANAPARSTPYAVTETEIVGEVVKVNKPARYVIVKDPAGKKARILVPAELLSLDDIKPGALLDLKFLPAFAVSVAKPGAAAPSAVEENIRLAPRGGMPAETTLKAKRLEARVVDFDKSRRELTVKGPEGMNLALQLPEDFMDWDSIKTGETLAIRYTDAVALTAAKREGENASGREFERSIRERTETDRTGTDTRRPGSDPLYQQRNEPMNAPGRDQTPNQQPSNTPNMPR